MHEISNSLPRIDDWFELLPVPRLFREVSGWWQVWQKAPRMSRRVGNLHPRIAPILGFRAGLAGCASDRGRARAACAPVDLLRMLQAHSMTGTTGSRPRASKLDPFHHQVTATCPEESRTKAGIGEENRQGDIR